MNKMIVTMVLEGNNDELKQIKGAIIAQAGETLVSMQSELLDEPKKELQCFAIGRTRK